MTIETLIKMIERRGYDVRRHTKIEESPGRSHRQDIEILSISNRDMMIRHAFSTLHLTSLYDELFRVEVEEILSQLSESQHHMACIQCKEPLLQNITKIKRWTEDVSDLKKLQWHINQIPWTELLKICPGCGIDLEPGTVVEIKDEEECIDCLLDLPFVKTGKAYKKDTKLYECDDPECKHKVCRQHLYSLYTLGDYCSRHAEQQKEKNL